MSHMSDDDFILHIMGNLSKGYDAVLTNLENKLIADSSQDLTIELMHQKLKSSFLNISK